MNSLLTYGLDRSESLVHVQDVKNGLKCDCRCPNCRHPLVAKNNTNNKKASHFAHSSGKECDGAVESALHLLAKDVFLKTKKIATPAFHYDYNTSNPASLFRAGKTIELDTVILEEYCYLGKDCLIPDAIGVKKSKRLFVEFANFHFVDEIKRERIKRSGIACIEIDVSSLSLDREAIESVLLDQNSPLKYWIVNQRLEQEYEAARIESEEKEAEQKRQKQLDIERNRTINQEKIRKYPLNAFPKPRLVSRSGTIPTCPLKKKELEKLPTRFQGIPAIKRIIDGAHWNGEFYPQGIVSPNGRYVYIGKDQVYVYPPDRERDFRNEEAEKNHRLFDVALRECKTILEEKVFDNCRNCHHFVDRFYIDEKDYRVCNYKND